MPYFRVTLSSNEREAMLDLVRRHEVAVFRHTAREREDGGYHVDAILESEQIERLREAGYEIEQHEDVYEEGKKRQAEVGQGDDYYPPEESSSRSAGLS